MARPDACRRHLPVRRRGPNHREARKQGQPDYPTPMPFCSPVSYTDPQLLRFVEDDETADDYGRDSREDDAFEDDATEGEGQ